MFFFKSLLFFLQHRFCSLIYLLFCTSKLGWGFEAYRNECNKGEGVKLSRGLGVYLKYILPVLIAVILISGLI